MLRLLSLLQTHRYWPGHELSERLEVSARTLRRDVDRLRDLGYTVDAVRGAAGGYQLRAGGSLPPLLLEDDEAVAIAVGLRTAAVGALADDRSVQALSKVLSLMPPRLRRQMDAVASQTDAPGPWEGAPVIDATVLTTLAQACRDSELLRFDYAAREAEVTHRRVEPEAAPVGPVAVPGDEVPPAAEGDEAQRLDTSMGHLGLARGVVEAQQLAVAARLRQRGQHRRLADRRPRTVGRRPRDRRDGADHAGAASAA